MPINRGIGADKRTRRSLAAIVGDGSGTRNAKVARFKGGIEVYECGPTAFALWDTASGDNPYLHIGRSVGPSATIAMRFGETYADPIMDLFSGAGGRILCGRPLLLTESASVWTADDTGEALIQPVSVASETKLEVQLYWDASPSGPGAYVTRTLAQSDRLVPHYVSYFTSGGGIPTTYTPTLHENILLGDAVTDPLTVALPSATDADGHEFVVKKIDATANTITLDCDGADTIDDAATYVLTTQYEKVRIVAKFGVWYIV